jgi:hypothetical protein
MRARWPFTVLAVTFLPAWKDFKACQNWEPARSEKTTDIIDQTKTFRPLEQRIAKTTNPRHLRMLKRVLQHAIGEAKLDLDNVMPTLGPSPRYITLGHRRI